MDRGTLAMAVLPLPEVWDLVEDGDASTQQTAVAEFAAAAFNTCLDVLRS